MADDAAPPAPRPIECAEAVRRLWAYVDGELPALSAEEVREHLRTCAVCGELGELQRRFRALLQDTRGDDRGLDALRSRVRAALALAQAQGLEADPPAGP